MILIVLTIISKYQNKQLTVTMNFVSCRTWLTSLTQNVYREVLCQCELSALYETTIILLEK